MIRTEIVLVIGLLICTIQPCLSMTQDDYSFFLEWLATDNTDEQPYVNVTFDCLAFSQITTENANKAGFENVYMANLQGSKYPEGHWVLAVLVDGEYKFIEPQADKEQALKGAKILIVDNDFKGQKRINGINDILVSGEVLIPIKTPK